MPVIQKAQADGMKHRLRAEPEGYPGTVWWPVEAIQVHRILKLA